MKEDEALITLHQEIYWLQSVIDQVICSYLQQEGHERDWLSIEPPDLTDNESPYAQLVGKMSLNKFERLALTLSICPHLRPEALDIFFGKNQLYDRGFTEFGGLIDQQHSGFIPTGQTLSFLMTSIYPSLRHELDKVLGSKSSLRKEQIILLGSVEQSIPEYNGALSLGENWFYYFLSGEEIPMEQSASFPAQRIETPMNWDDLVVSDLVLEQLEEIATWLNKSEVLMQDWGLSKLLKPGYRALFYGPPGTGKTLTATLLGKATQREVYKVDLSMIVSKYIGETEKNLARVFDIAQHKDWILFFDEADALFGKRTAANSSNDRHANQQTSYLLQRIEDFPGVVILASNLKANMDEAFTRRFQNMIHFPMPSVEERIQLWTKAFSAGCQLESDIDLYQVAENYEIAGGSIANVLRNCALKAIQMDKIKVDKVTLLNAVKREFQKENKTLNQFIN